MCEPIKNKYKIALCERGRGWGNSVILLWVTEGVDGLGVVLAIKKAFFSFIILSLLLFNSFLALMRIDIVLELSFYRN
jgi:hypothetical protein